jgi:hypothetical protein
MRYAALTLFFILAAAFLVYGLEEPREPRVPEAQFPGSETTATNYTSVSTNQVVTPARAAKWRVRVFYVDGRTLEGVAEFAYTDYFIEFDEQKTKFYRKLSLAETASIRVNRWKGVLSSGDEKRALYFFMPELYRVITKGGEVYRLDKRMKILDTLEITTARGTARVYTYFADYWSGTEEYGQWENSGSAEFGYNDTRPHPETVYRIDFIAEA